MQRVTVSVCLVAPAMFAIRRAFHQFESLDCYKSPRVFLESRSTSDKIIPKQGAYVGYVLLVVELANMTIVGYRLCARVVSNFTSNSHAEVVLTYIVNM